ncbi:MAG: hypothetical protein AB7F86_06840 [Bdellovibrionales bacterium]
MKRLWSRNVAICVLALLVCPIWTSHAADLGDCEGPLTGQIFHSLDEARKAEDMAGYKHKVLPFRTVVGNLQSPELINAAEKDDYNLRSFDWIHDNRAMLLKRSQHKIIGVNAATLYLGMFLSKSQFAIIAQGTNKFPPLEEFERLLDNQTYVIWHPDGRLEKRSSGYRSESTARFAAAYKDSRPHFFRGGGYECHLIRLHWANDPAEIENLKDSLITGWGLPNSLKRLSKEEFLIKAFAGRTETSPFVFFTPIPNWASYFATDTNEITEFEVQTQFPVDQWPRMYLGADNYGSFPSPLEMALRMKDFEDFLRVAAFLKPVDVLNGSAAHAIRYENELGQRKFQIPKELIRNELNKKDPDFERILALFSRDPRIREKLQGSEVRKMIQVYQDQSEHFDFARISHQYRIDFRKIFYLSMLLNRFDEVSRRDLASQSYFSLDELEWLSFLSSRADLELVLAGQSDSKQVLERIKSHSRFHGKLEISDIMKLVQLSFTVRMGSSPTLRSQHLVVGARGKLLLNPAVKLALGDLGKWLE